MIKELQLAFVEILYGWSLLQLEYREISTVKNPKSMLENTVAESLADLI